MSAGSNSDLREAVIELLLLSLLSLFLELLIIRWLATEVRIFAYFKNLPLMAAFLGLGLGYIWNGEKLDLFRLSPTLLLYLSGILSVALSLGLTFLIFVDPLQFMIFGFESDPSKVQGIWLSIRTLAIMLALFLLATSIFVGIGQRLGQLFSLLPPLKAYSVNVLGSLLGTVLFSLLSWIQSGPGVWLGVAGVLYFLINRQTKVASACLIAFGIFYTVWLGPAIAKTAYGANYVQTVWSPYYRIDVASYRPDNGPAKGVRLGYEVYVNYDGMCAITDCSPQSLSTLAPSIKEVLLADHASVFKLLPNPAEATVLILGSGAGADVAAALRAGVGHIDAVEIDPAIGQIGTDLHPEAPYKSNRVRLCINDARTFLGHCQDKYDLILFAYLDSHTAFSCLTSLRTDNYVFTSEALKDAYKLLKPEGVMALGCVLMSEWLWDRHTTNMFRASGMEPLGFGDTTVSKMNTAILLTGPGVDGKQHKDIPITQPPHAVHPNNGVEPATDDWPFLFLPKREIPALYILPMLTILSACVLPILYQFRRGFASHKNWQMVLVGMAFMLLEVRALADLSLLFGSTWIVNSVIIGGVMIVILIANNIIDRLPALNKKIVGPGLLLSLVLPLSIRSGQLTGLGTMAGAAIGTVVYLIPMLFGACLFAILFKSAKDTPTALAFNLVGGVIGICLEYLSMLTGIHALGWIVFILYALALGTEMLVKPASSD